MIQTAGSQPRQPVSTGDRLAIATLTRIATPADVGLARFVAAHGPRATCAAIESGDYPGDGLAGYRLRLADADPARDLAAAAAIGSRLVCPGDSEWPDSLVDLDRAELMNGRGGAPLALWVRGERKLVELGSRSCAVVGSRAASEYGTYLAGELGAGLADREITVISGGALGIDAAAHRGALASTGATVAVLACGIDVAYPRAHRELFDRIATDGLLVSEVPPGATPTRAGFLIRNRLIAALARGTVVVEAALRSGALNTAAWTAECQRELMAMPGPVTSPMSAGAHELVRNGRAVLVTDAAEVAEQLAPIGSELAPAKIGAPRPRDELDDQASQVLDAVPVRNAKGVAAIATAAGLGVDATLGVLGRLSLLDYVERYDTGWRLSQTARRHQRAPSTNSDSDSDSDS